MPPNPEVDFVSSGPWNRSHLTLLNIEVISKHLSERPSSFEAPEEEREAHHDGLSALRMQISHTEKRVGCESTGWESRIELEAGDSLDPLAV